MDNSVWVCRHYFPEGKCKQCETDRCEVCHRSRLACDQDVMANGVLADRDCDGKDIASTEARDAITKAES